MKLGWWWSCFLYDTLPDVYDGGMEFGHKMATASSISCVEVFLRGEGGGEEMRGRRRMMFYQSWNEHFSISC